MTQDVFIEFWKASIFWVIPIGFIIGAFIHGYKDGEDPGLTAVISLVLSVLWPFTLIGVALVFVWSIVSAVGDFFRSHKT